MPHTPNTTIAFLGLGAMGTRMAQRLLDAGHSITVWNRTPSAADALVESGARRAATPRQAVVDADVVVAMVRDDEASRQVWLGDDGAAAALGAGTLALDASTLTPEWTRELSTALTAQGAAFVEAPVVGSRPQAEAGQLICLVGGPKAEVDRATPILQAFAGRVVHLGEVGLGAVAKLAVNAFFATQVAAAAETVQFLRNAGIEDERWLDLFSNLPVVAPPIAGTMKGMALGQFPPMFPIELVEKDLGYFVRSAGAHGIPSPVTDTIRGLYAKAIDAGHGGDNIHGIVQIF